MIERTAVGQWEESIPLTYRRHDQLVNYPTVHRGSIFFREHPAAAK
jgi:hypothetical protein